jgi:hypothetical protein
MNQFKDTTEDEMRNTLREIRLEFMPEESSAFLNDLSKDHLIIVFDLIQVKDMKKQVEIREQIRQNMAADKGKVQNILFKANKRLIQWKEEHTKI